MAVTDQQTMNEIQFHVVEPANNGATWPSGLWSQAEVLQYLNQRQDRFMKETGLVTTTASIAVTGNSGNRFNLPSTWMGTFRAAWKDSSPKQQGLKRSDTWEVDLGRQTWETTSGTPQEYMDAETPTLQIQLAPEPAVNGSVELLYIALCTTLDGSGINLTVPDEFAPYIKWGALADMLEKVLGRQNDPDRAAYCEMRYREGILLAQLIVGDRQWQ